MNPLLPALFRKALALLVPFHLPLPFLTGAFLSLPILLLQVSKLRLVPPMRLDALVRLLAAPLLLPLLLHPLFLFSLLPQPVLLQSLLALVLLLHTLLLLVLLALTLLFLMLLALAILLFVLALPFLFLAFLSVPFLLHALLLLALLALLLNLLLSLAFSLLKLFLLAALFVAVFLWGGPFRCRVWLRLIRVALRSGSEEKEENRHRDKPDALHRWHPRSQILDGPA